MLSSIVPPPKRTRTRNEFEPHASICIVSWRLPVMGTTYSNTLGDVLPSVNKQENKILYCTIVVIMNADAKISWNTVTSRNPAYRVLQMMFVLFGLAAPALVLSVELYDDFTSYNSSTFSYADKTVGHTDGCEVYYLKNHSLVNASLSLHEGEGLKMLMSATPCKQNPKECRG